MWRKPGFWVGFVVVACICAVFGVTNFPRAFPIVTLDLEMDREGALQRAEDLAGRFHWGPAEHQQAASFDLDRQVQSFVELEAGGKAAFSEMLSGGLYWPYRWVVRHFAEFEANETLVRFSPAGEPVGFVETLPEDQPGPALDVVIARRIAERSAIRDWGVVIDDFRLVEEAEEARPSGRVDHTFVYERAQPTVGDEGRYRLRLIVSGDRFTELTHFVKVPESFSRRYEEMRSANNGIATGASIAAAIFYVIGGCVIGLFMLLRQRWVLWKQPLMWGLFVAFLQALVILNQWPLTWMGYDTAISSTNFAMRLVVQAVVTFIGMGILLTVSFMAAESLSRKAFPEHLQLWKTWKPDIAGSLPVTGMTIAGYLLVAVFFAYDVALYLFASGVLGWWNPSFALFDPDVMATYVPWLSPVAISLQAGFWEECLFRAIPLASAALIGQKYGGRKWWILGALILQAVIFGAGHANYPAQPAYARLVELIIPAIGFGLIYLVFGLLPAIVLHFAFDVVWFALPLFAASTPGIWVDRFCVILLTLLPLWIVFNSRRKMGEWAEAPDDARNSAWRPPDVVEPIEPIERAPRTVGLASQIQVALVVLGIGGLILWVSLGDFTTDVSTLSAERGTAVTAARDEIRVRDVEIPESWREMSRVLDQPRIEDRFIWQEGGQGAYDVLMESYLAPPGWLVRYASFEGDVVERAEEYRVWIGPGGEVLRFAHWLPESRDGDALDEDVARSYAQSVVQDRFGLDPEGLREVSAEPERQPDRVDWKFVFADDRSYPLDQGEARIAVHIAGNEIVDSYRFVHIPEEWERAERNRGSMVSLVRAVCTIAMVLVFVAGAVIAIVRWSRGLFSTRTFWMAFGFLAALSAVDLFNGWPEIVAQFSTAQPYSLQSAVVVAGGILAMVAMAIGIALVVGLIHRWIPQQPGRLGIFDILAGSGLGLAVSGIAVVATRFALPLDPAWPSLGAAGARLPLLATAVGPIGGWIGGTVFLLLVYTIVDTVSRGWAKKRLLMTAALVAVGFIIAGADGLSTIPRWVAEGALTGLVIWLAYVLVFRRHMALVPVAAAAISAVSILREGALRAYPGALSGSITAAVLTVIVGIAWMIQMTRDSVTE